MALVDCGIPRARKSSPTCPVAALEAWLRESIYQICDGFCRRRLDTATAGSHNAALIWVNSSYGHDCPEVGRRDDPTGSIAPIRRRVQSGRGQSMVSTDYEWLHGWIPALQV